MRTCDGCGAEWGSEKFGFLLSDWYHFGQFGDDPKRRVHSFTLCHDCGRVAEDYLRERFPPRSSPTQPDTKEKPK